MLLLCYLSLIVYAKRKAAGAEKKRLVYLIIACTAAIATYSIPPLFNLIVAGMLYFILIMITHPHLTELHDLMTRALVILIVTLFTTVFFYLVIGFFGKGPAPPFTLVFMVSFLIIIAIGPFQVILKRLLTRIYPEIKDVFTSPYDLDEKLETGKGAASGEDGPRPRPRDPEPPRFDQGGRPGPPLGGGKRGAAETPRRDHRGGEPPEPGRLAVSRLRPALRAGSAPAVDQRGHRKGPGPHRGEQHLGPDRYPVGAPSPSAARSRWTRSRSTRSS